MPGEKSAHDKQRVEEFTSDTSSEDDSAEMSSEEEDTSWITWYCGLPGNEFYCEVDEDFISDDFNLTGLRGMVPHFDDALDVILDTDSDIHSEEHQKMIDSAAETLYGLIHARFILTNRGLAAMLEKFKSLNFGRCPRAYCGQQAVLPVGQTDVPRVSTVKLYCPKCQDIYIPKRRRHANIDGAYFGTTFPHLLLQMYPDQIPPRSTQTYVPRIYGFKIHKSAFPQNSSSTTATTSAAPASSTSKAGPSSRGKK